MKKRNMSLIEALDHVKNKRPQIAPNEGFIMQLHNFEKSLGGIIFPHPFPIIRKLFVNFSLVRS